jgi:UDP-N-acetylmuramate dehydrogenase
VDEISEALAWARDHSQPVFILGGGSNLLISDDGFDGLVLQIDLHGISIESNVGTHAMVKVAAGEPWDTL